ncbi:hypothetical protein AB0C12_10355 [Actinoplanes sp. NPDC048967]|uniref:hypothetical protein n=1 Tax=Actinoplanes sp. NPDC048967 TaxID=3155269 RepID=UPI0033E9CCFE
MVSAERKGGVKSPGSDPTIIAHVNSLGERAQNTEDIIDLLYYWKLLATVESPSGLPTTLGKIYQDLLATPLERELSIRPLQNCSVHLVRRTAALLHRAKLTSVLLRLQYDPQLRQGDAKHLQELLDAGESVFASGSGLLKGLYGFDVYLGPLMGSLTPGVWGFAAVRSFGAILFSLGRPLAGTRPRAAEMLHLLPSAGAAVSTWKNPELEAASCSEAATWWVNRLNDLFSAITDPVLFAEPTGAYDPARHHQALMTVEQLFNRVNSIITSHRDKNAQLVLLFTVLDTLERLLGKSINDLCDLSFAEKTLESLRSSLPAGAAAVLLPSAERGITALKQMRDGFFLASTVQGITPERATAQYIKILRNATHGHGTNRLTAVQENNALLAGHDGEVPPDLSLLGFMYLLSLLNKPNDLRRYLSRGKVS